MKRVVRVDFVIDPDVVNIENTDEATEGLVREMIGEMIDKWHPTISRETQVTITSVEALADDAILCDTMEIAEQDLHNSRPWLEAKPLDQSEVNVAEIYHTLACQKQWQSGKCICMTVSTDAWMTKEDYAKLKDEPDA